MKPKELKIY